MNSEMGTACLEVSTTARRSRRTFLVCINGLAVAPTAGAVTAGLDAFAWSVLAILAVLLLVLDWFALRGRTWLDGSVLSQRRIGTRRTDVARAVSFQLCCDNRCGARLVVTDERGDSASAELLSLPPGTICGVSSEALERLALALARSPADGSGAASRLLRQQAEWVAAGGSLRSSPLFPFATGQHGRLVEAAELPGLVARPEVGDPNPELSL
jgi:hypothetical protein